MTTREPGRIGSRSGYRKKPAHGEQLQLHHGPVEIERKFLVANDDRRPFAKGLRPATDLESKFSSVTGFLP
jgi:hypothetical protein